MENWDPPTSLLVYLSAASLILASFIAVATPGSSDAKWVQSAPASSAPYSSHGRHADPSSLPTATETCPVSSLDDLHPLERSPRTHSLSHPRHPRRHPVPPPSNAGGTTALVCCRTTAGPLTAAVHSSWAPHGARRFLDMVKSGYFDGAAPFHRCSDGGGDKTGT
eukprot:CAMPEP_0113585302 /NCGR_PEP_ID=MMETSP0015_2-20120614/33613_1 /TAXON_ID=2838 /ORGANISM="Odontella" /LENGTH=164 /DNA_ID=CAMNT_0000490507 /DNA_START=248 /DNA_END=739 /DNA_ORIENTATION=- /assembly_acc=CAM_ASM_000160